MKKSFKTLGIWLGFEYQIPMRREGIGRYIFYLVKHLLINHDVKCEIWCYDVNLNEVNEMFYEILSDKHYQDKIFICTNDLNKTLWQNFTNSLKFALFLLTTTTISWKQPYRNYKSSFSCSISKLSFCRYAVDKFFRLIIIIFSLLICALRTLRLSNVFTKNANHININCVDLPGFTGAAYGQGKIAIEGRDKGGYLVYGHHFGLRDGVYQLKLTYRAINPNSGPIGEWDICLNGNQVVKKGDIPLGENGVISETILINARTALVEMRVRYSGYGTLQVNDLAISEIVLKGLEKKCDLLASTANKHSTADCFLVPIVILKNALDINKPKVVALHDLAALEFADLFAALDPAFLSSNADIKNIASSFAKQNSFFVSNSDFVRSNHTLKHVNHILMENTGFIYLPAIIPSGIDSKVPDKDFIVTKYNIYHNYIFYPTQFRPYKNVIVLLKALRKLLDTGYNIDLVLTGYLEHAKNLADFIKETRLESNVIVLNDVPEIDLYALHKYALSTVVPTLFEGGFPWQGLEAMLMQTPAIMSNIPVTVERLKYAGLDPNTCGLKLFDPNSEEDLVCKVIEVLSDRNRAVSNQEIVKQKLMSYTWDDVSNQYYDLFDKVVSDLFC